MKKFAVTAVGLCPPGAVWRALGGMVSKQEWSPAMQDILRDLGADFGSPYSKWPVFLLPRQFDAARRAVQILREMGQPPVFEYGTVGNPSSDNVASVKWYSVLYPESSEGFDAEGMFEKEWPCELPTPERVAGVRGCSLRKRQVQKLAVRPGAQIKSADFISAWLPFFSFPWQALIVTSRLRDALGNSDLRGFSFLPVAGPGASDEDRLLETGANRTDSADLFQLVIEGRTKPRTISDFLSVERADGKRDCTLCGRRTGDPQQSPLYEEGTFDSTADIQICEEFELPSGQRIPNTDGELIASSRFVEFCVAGKFKGLSALAGRAPSFSALYLGPAV